MSPHGGAHQLVYSGDADLHPPGDYQPVFVMCRACHDTATLMVDKAGAMERERRWLEHKGHVWHLRQTGDLCGAAKCLERTGK